MELIDRAFEEIQVGDGASFTRTITGEDIALFARLSGDENPLHTDAAYAADTVFRQPVAHGMLVASFFSALLGMHLPGKQCLLMQESLTFKKPVFAGDELLIKGEVTAKSESTRVLEISLSAIRGMDEVAASVAHVQVRL